MAKKTKKTSAPTPEAAPIRKSRRPWLKVAIPFLSVLVVIVGCVILFEIYFLNRIFPGISINGVNVTGLTIDQARQKVLATTNNRHQTLTFNHQDSQYQVTLDPQETELELDQTLNQAFQFGHNRFYFNPIQIYLTPTFNTDFDIKLNPIKTSVNQAPVESQLLIDNSEITVTPSQDGQVLDETELKKRLADYLATGQLTSNELPMRKAYPKLSYAAALNIKHLLDKTRLQPIKLTYQDRTWTIDANTLISLLDLKNSQSSLASTEINATPVNIGSIIVGDQETQDSKLALDDTKLSQYFQKIAAELDRPVQEPLLQFDGTRVTEFQPPTIGLKLNIERTKTKFTQALTADNHQPIALVVETTEPKNKLSNELGIKELVAEGVSNFAHSIPNRIYNIGLAASRVNGVIIPPGEVFSFVKTVGDISAASGYKQGYIIKDGRTVLDDGGGVCQVSTTLFRAALNAGLPIVQRTAHAYRVEYYEQGFPPGLDATIFSPTVDFKFKNDTQASILIQTRIEGTTLYVDFYGTKDGRVVNLTKPVILSTTPPLPEIRQDDPTLPKGTVKQVDFPASGANVIFNRTVTRNGETLINESFRSNYRPWQAVYLVGTKEG